MTSELGNPEPSDFSGYSYQKRLYCPICKGVEIESIAAPVLPIVGLSSTQITFGRCERCGHIFQSVPAPERLRNSYYALFSNYASQQKETVPGPMSQRFLSLAKGFIPEPGIMLEVGCATGRHLYHFQQAGWEAWGCDPSPGACAKGLELYGLEIDCGTEDRILPEHKNLDLILYSGVLEHLEQPQEALLRAHAALRSSGFLMFEVPLNAFPHLLPPGWFCFEHLQYFNLNTLNNLMELTGFTLLETRISMKGFMYPCISGIAYKGGGTPARYEPQASEEFLRTYVRRDIARWKQSIAYIDRVPKPFHLWGAGIHTSQLFSFYPELIQHTTSIIDSDPQKEGQTLAGIPVISPADIPASAHVIISSFAQEKEIYEAWIAEPGRDLFHIHRLYNSK